MSDNDEMHPFAALAPSPMSAPSGSRPAGRRHRLMPDQAMKRRGWFAAASIAAASFLDVLVVQLTVPFEGGRVLLPLDLSRPAVIVAVYAGLLSLLFVLSLVARKLLLFGARGARILVLLAVVLLLARGLLAWQGSGAPFDRARAARTVARLRDADERVREYRRLHGRLPTDLREAGLSGRDLEDEWRHEFRFELLPGANGYRLWSDGAPAGRRGLEDYYPRLTIERAEEDKSLPPRKVLAPTPPRRDTRP